MKRKLRKYVKAICALLAAAAVLGGGFMGVDKFNPEKRSLTIVEGPDSVTTAVEAQGDGETLDPGVSAKAAILIDGSSGKVIYEKESHKHLHPASVTKVMTLLLIMEGCDTGKISMDDEVVISENAAGMGGSQMYMEPGEKHTVEELVKGIIMVSANDACVAMAEHLCGSTDSFVREMNDKAMDMGLEDSHFVNTNGLPVAKHYSCAYDIGMISKELMEHEELKEWFTAWQDSIKVGLPGKEKDFTLTNTNKLIKNYSGAMGIKTGFTEDAGYCLAGAAERDGTRLIGVVLGCETSDIRFDEMSRMLDFGFANYETADIAEKGDTLYEASIPKADKTKVRAVAEDDIRLLVKKDSGEKIKKEVVMDKNIDLPIKKGDRLGTVIIYEDERKTAEYKIVSDRNVEKAGFGDIYIRMMKKLTN